MNDIEFENARNMMVTNQLRPNKINDLLILDLFRKIKKETFLEEKDKGIAYSDLDIQLIDNRGYLKNLHLAQLIQNSQIKKEHKVLHIGGLTGYVSTIISSICSKLIVLENETSLLEQLEKNIKYLKIENIKIYNQNLKNGFQDKSPYDIIFIDNPIQKVSDSIKEQLNSDYGMLIMIKKINENFSHAYKIIRNQNNYTEEYLFDIFTNFELYKDKKDFIFND